MDNLPSFLQINQESNNELNICDVLALSVHYTALDLGFSVHLDELSLLTNFYRKDNNCTNREIKYLTTSGICIVIRIVEVFDELSLIYAQSLQPSTSGSFGTPSNTASTVLNLNPTHFIKKLSSNSPNNHLSFQIGEWSLNFNELSLRLKTVLLYPLLDHQGQSPHIIYLPSVLHKLVISYLPIQECMLYNKVCKLTQSTLNTDEIWMILVHRDFPRIQPIFKNTNSNTQKYNKAIYKEQYTSTRINNININNTSHRRLLLQHQHHYHPHHPHLNPPWMRHSESFYPDLDMVFNPPPPIYQLHTDVLPLQLQLQPHHSHWYIGHNHHHHHHQSHFRVPHIMYNNDNDNDNDNDSYNNIREVFGCVSDYF